MFNGNIPTLHILRTFEIITQIATNTTHVTKTHFTNNCITLEIVPPSKHRNSLELYSAENDVCIPEMYKMEDIKTLQFI